MDRKLASQARNREFESPQGHQRLNRRYKQSSETTLSRVNDDMYRVGSRKPHSSVKVIVLEYHLQFGYWAGSATEKRSLTAKSRFAGQVHLWPCRLCLVQDTTLSLNQFNGKMFWTLSFKGKVLISIYNRNKRRNKNACENRFIY